MTPDIPCDLAIIGHGFCGATLLSRLAAGVTHPFSILVIDDGAYDGVGPAYATPDPLHRLNVPAGKMGAPAEDPGHFLSWLHANGYGDAQPYDFMPRRVYGDYLRALQKDAPIKNQISVRFHRARATSIHCAGDHYRIDCTDGTTAQARAVTLATGNSFTREPVCAAHITQPWFFDMRSIPAGDEPLIVLGTGLTAVDTILSVLAHTTRPVVCVSRGGHFPLAHTATPPPAPPDTPALPGNARLSHLMRLIRQHIAAYPDLPWQAAFDAFRPHHTAMWQSLNTHDQQRFLKRAFTLWNIHRHRMADDIARTVADARASGRLRVIKKAAAGLQPIQGGIQLTLKGGSTLTAPVLFDCRGPSYDDTHAHIAAPLLRDGIVTAHPNGAGLVSQDRQRVSVGTAPPLYAAGSWLFGERFESTAVPELRAQVKTLADQIIAGYRT